MYLPVYYPDLDPSERRKVREEYVKQQKGLCFYCNKPLVGKPSDEVLRTRINLNLFPVDFFKWPVHLQHDHETGMTEGAVHCQCNAVLWQYHGR